MSPACSFCNFIYSLSFTQGERERERKSSFYSFTKGLLSLSISRVTYTYTGGKAQLPARCCAEVVPTGTRLGVTSAAGEMQGVQHLGKVKETSFSSKIKEKAEIGSWPCCILFASGATAHCQSRGSVLISVALLSGELVGGFGLHGQNTLNVSTRVLLMAWPLDSHLRMSLSTCTCLYKHQWGPRALHGILQHLRIITAIPNPGYRQILVHPTSWSQYYFSAIPHLTGLGAAMITLWTWPSCFAYTLLSPST